MLFADTFPSRGSILALAGVERTTRICWCIQHLCRYPCSHITRDNATNNPIAILHHQRHHHRPEMPPPAGGRRLTRPAGTLTCLCHGYGHREGGMRWDGEQVWISAGGFRLAKIDTGINPAAPQRAARVNGSGEGPASMTAARPLGIVPGLWVCCVAGWSSEIWGEGEVTVDEI
jgi:hypothetical protein